MPLTERLRTVLTVTLATATVSGLAAYWAGLPSFNSPWNDQTPWRQRVLDLRAQLIGKAYSRQKGQQLYPLGLWKGVTEVNGHRGGNYKRDFLWTPSLGNSTLPITSMEDSRSANNTTVQIEDLPIVVRIMDNNKLATKMSKTLSSLTTTTSLASQVVF